ncbi:type II toxin-antitoxin system HicA family toxin [Piscinibacter sakaiensis]
MRGSGGAEALGRGAGLLSCVSYTNEVVPHPKKDLGIGLVKAIRQQAGI